MLGRRKAPLARTAGLARGPGPTRKQGLCKQSRARRRAKVTQQQAYAAADDAGQQWCGACGKAGEVAHSHLFTQGRHAAHRDNPLNWLQLGKWCECHMLWEHNKAGFKAAYPAAWAESVRRMELVDATAFRFFQLKNPTLF